MKTIQITNTYRGEVLALVQSCVPAGFRIRTLEENTREALAACAEDADYILASGRIKLDGFVLDRANKLKMIQRTGVGLDSLDLSELQRRGIPLYVNQGVNSRSVAEHTLMLMLACLRRLPEISQNTKAGHWVKQAQGIRTRELGKCTVGIIGMGHIGQAVAGLLKPFGAKVYYHSRHPLTKEREEELGIAYLSREELLGAADIVTLHCPLTRDTQEMINQDTLALAKESLIIINTARGKLIREADLFAALQREKVSFAGLDVFEAEPPENLTLLQHPHVIATPHIGGVTYDSFHQMMSEAMRNIRLFDEGKLQEIEACRVKIEEKV